MPYFPREKGKPEPCKLSDDELVFILNQAKPEEWQATVILGANIELYKFDFQGTVDYFEKLEVMKALETKHRKIERSDNTDSNKGNKKRKTKSVRPRHSLKILSVQPAVVRTMHQKTVGLVQRTRANLNLAKSLRPKRSC